MPGIELRGNDEENLKERHAPLVGKRHVPAAKEVGKLSTKQGKEPRPLWNTR